jgi:YgiT-type zinc finger domain-containing protein
MNHICPFCKGLIEDGEAIFTVDLGCGIIVVKEVPALVCSLCGADWISDNIAEKLEKIVESARKKRLMVEIASYQNELKAAA